MLSALLLVASTAGPADAARPTLANPASVFCEAHGGKSTIETAPNGARVGTCVFANGTRINEWAYFRSMHRTRN